MFKAPLTTLTALRLKPDQDLRQELEAAAASARWSSAFVLRLADAQAATSRHGHFEIVSLVGTLGPDGVHLHLAVSDEKGQMWGGHLLTGCLIYTTAEIVIGHAAGLTFHRTLDEATGFQELAITPTPTS
jgi:uncharacterized protein